MLLELIAAMGLPTSFQFVRNSEQSSKDLLLPVLIIFKFLVPVPYRCNEKHPLFFSLEDENKDNKVQHTWGKPFPTALDPFYCNRYDIAEFGR